MKKLTKLTKEFLNELEEIAGKKWKGILNHFEDMAIEELSKLAGFLPGPGDLSLEERVELALKNWLKHQKKEDHPKEMKEKAPPYPKAFLWTNHNGKNYISGIKNQGFCNSCVAFGSLAVVEAMAQIKKDESIDPKKESDTFNLSEAQLFFKSPGKHNCFTGWNLGGALSYLTDTGVIPNKDFPYNHNNKAEKLPEGWEKKTTIIESDVTLDTHYAMKKWLREKGPLISAVQLHLDFFFYHRGVYHPLTDHALGGHCIAVIGYDDEKEAWYCKNSWGPHWGDNGYFWIGYGQCGVDSQMIGIENFKKIYTGE